MTSAERPITLGRYLSPTRTENVRPPQEEFTVPDHLTQDTTADVIRTRVRAAVLKLAPHAPEEVRPNESLAGDLNFDSLTLLELAVELEREFELRGFQDGVGDIQIDTVGDVENLIVQLVGEGAE